MVIYVCVQFILYIAQIFLALLRKLAGNTGNTKNYREYIGFVRIIFKIKDAHITGYKYFNEQFYETYTHFKNFSDQKMCIYNYKIYQSKND